MAVHHFQYNHEKQGGFYFIDNTVKIMCPSKYRQEVRLTMLVMPCLELVDVHVTVPCLATSQVPLFYNDSPVAVNIFLLLVPSS